MKKLTLFFLLNPVPFNGHSYKKQNRSGTSGQLLFWLQKKFTKISLLVIYYLAKFDDVIWNSYWVIPKITPVNLWKPIHDIINYSTSICSFEFGKCGKEDKKITKMWISWEQKDFLRLNKKHFSQFLKGYNLVRK